MNRLEILRDRANMLGRARLFFKKRGIVEVDCPLLTEKASVDLHIDLIPAVYNQSETRYLHSSPEYGMKRLLVEGIGDCYQLAHVFRDGEYGRKHNPEFMLAEWYRLGADFDPFIQETLDFIRLFLGDLTASVISYREAFEKYLEIDPFLSTDAELANLLVRHHIESHAIDDGKDSLLNVLMGTVIESKLGDGELTVLRYYPASQAALAKTKIINGNLVASRFEIYYKGVELCNGYDELADSKEQAFRLNEANANRIAIGKSPLPVDTSFLAALDLGLPSCCGVAVGFDRLMMLRHQTECLADVIPFEWKKA